MTVVKGTVIVLSEDELDVGVGETVGDTAKVETDAGMVLRMVDADV